MPGSRRHPFLDWFHIAMRIQHAAQTASGLPADCPGRMQAKTVIVEEVERLRWRIWNGKARNAKRSIDRVRKVMHAYKERTRPYTRGARLRAGCGTHLLDVDGYLRGQSSWLTNYAKRYRADLRVGTSITEGTANFLVNRWARHDLAQYHRLLMRALCCADNAAASMRSAQDRFLSVRRTGRSCERLALVPQVRRPFRQ